MIRGRFEVLSYDDQPRLFNEASLALKNVLRTADEDEVVYLVQTSLADHRWLVDIDDEEVITVFWSSRNMCHEFQFHPGLHSRAARERGHNYSGRFE